jgi:hypothetical protein
MDADDSGFGDTSVKDQRRLDFSGGETVSRDVDDIYVPLSSCLVK